MTDRLTEEDLDRLETVLSLPQQAGWEPDALTVHAECIYRDSSNGPDSMVVREDNGDHVAHVAHDSRGGYVAHLAAAAHNSLPALLAEVREHRAREDEADLRALDEARANDDGTRTPLRDFMEETRDD